MDFKSFGNGAIRAVNGIISGIIVPVFSFADSTPLLYCSFKGGVLKAIAIGEGIRAYARDTLRYHNACKAIAAAERLPAYACHRKTVMCIRNYDNPIFAGSDSAHVEAFSSGFGINISPDELRLPQAENINTIDDINNTDNTNDIIFKKFLLMSFYPRDILFHHITLIM